MSPLQFRFGYLTPLYEETLAFYRDGLGLEILESWDRTPLDRGTLFRAAGGIVEVLLRPPGPAPHELDPRPPQGTWMGIEVAEVRETYRQARERRLPLIQDLKDQPWGHRSFSVRDPNGLTIIVFSEMSGAAPGA